MKAVLPPTLILKIEFSFTITSARHMDYYTAGLDILVSLLSILSQTCQSVVRVNKLLSLPKSPFCDLGCIAHGPRLRTHP